MCAVDNSVFDATKCVFILISYTCFQSFEKYCGMPVTLPDLWPNTHSHVLDQRSSCFLLCLARSPPEPFHKLELSKAWQIRVLWLEDRRLKLKPATLICTLAILCHLGFFFPIVASFVSLRQLCAIIFNRVQNCVGAECVEVRPNSTTSNNIIEIAIVQLKDAFALR